MYQYTGCGLEGIFLKNGFTVKETPYGRAVAIDDVEGLHRAIALDIVRKKSPMSGHQFRFLRKEQDLTQEETAGMFRVDVQTIANWEKRGKQEIPGPADVAMRAYYLAYAHQQFSSPDFAVGSSADERGEFQHSDDGWVPDQAA